MMWVSGDGAWPSAMAWPPQKRNVPAPAEGDGDWKAWAFRRAGLTCQPSFLRRIRAAGRARSRDIVTHSHDLVDRTPARIVRVNLLFTIFSRDGSPARAWGAKCCVGRRTLLGLEGGDGLDGRTGRTVEEALAGRAFRQPDRQAAWRRHPQRGDRQGPPL